MQVKVAALIVTYGERNAYLNQVVAGLREQGDRLSELVVVFNGNAIQAEAFSASNEHFRVHKVVLPSNQGSAAGFKAALSYAWKHSSAEYFWLLDDDNQPQLGSLEHLLRGLELLGGSEDVLMLSLRRNRREFLHTACCGAPVRIRPNSFHGFHFKSLVTQPRLPGRSHRQDPLTADQFRFIIAQVEYAPYGGLLLHRDWLRRVGYPNEDYVLYADDHEFTTRIVKEGGRIYLCPLSEIHDLENSFHWKNEGLGGHLLSSDDDPLRLYYGTRNRVHMELNGFVTSRVTYFCNILTCLLLLFCWQLLTERCPLPLVKRLALVIEAIKDGWTNRLGFNAKYVLP
ncbi:MAG: glycosyltransferase [Gammaproteobacteria bacterium]|nr:MAG: glycosyltransferase [Gammaproteobacteria bacterium]